MGSSVDSADEKQQVHDFWNAEACGERLLLDEMTLEGLRAQAEERYRLEPFIPEFAEFAQWADKDVLEIGLGLGADHEQFAVAGARLSGIDLTERSVQMTRERLAFRGLESDIRVGDAEKLPFPDDSFDLVYSWGVIHHSPDTSRAASEILRVLRPGGVFKVMVYHYWSLVGLMLWARYALLRGRPFVSLESIYSTYLESPGTKAYTPEEGRRLFEGARDVSARTVLTHGDLLESGAGQRHEGRLLEIARRTWPRWLLRRACKGMGLFLLIEGSKGRQT